MNEDFNALIRLFSDLFGDKPKRFVFPRKSVKSRKVYRVENDDRHGPYNCDCPTEDQLQSLLALHNGVAGSKSHPTWPDEKNEMWPPDSWHFGFKDLDQLRAWFSRDERMKMAALGFMVNVYETHALRVSDHQAIFNTKASKRVDRLDLSAV